MWLLDTKCNIKIYLSYTSHVDPTRHMFIPLLKVKGAREVRSMFFLLLHRRGVQLFLDSEVTPLGCAHEDYVAQLVEQGIDTVRFTLAPITR